MKTLELLFEKYKRYKSAIILICSTLMLFFSTFWSPLFYVFYVLIFAFYLTCDFGEFLCYTMYFSMFSGILPIFIVTVGIGFAITFVRYIVDLIRKKVKFYAIPFVITLVIVLVFSLIKYEVVKDEIDQGLMYIVLLLGLYLAFAYRNEINVSKCFEYLSLGILVSLFMSLVVFIIPKCSALVELESNKYDVQSLKEYLVAEDPSGKRLRLLTFHTNHLGILCIFMISYIVSAMLTKKQKTKWFYIYFVSIFVISSVLGFLTLSKAFMLVFALIMLYAFVCSIIRFKKKSIYYIIPMAVMLLVAGIVLRHKITDIFGRFTSKEDSFWSVITTGRTDIWKIYLEKIKSTKMTLAFGHGFFTQKGYYIGAHNIYIELLYRFGIVGIIMLAGLAVSYYFSSDRKLHFSYKNCIVLLVFLIYGLEEMIFNERFIFFFILGIAMLLREKKENAEIENDLDKTLAKDEKIVYNENK